MTISLTQSMTAIGPNVPASFLAIGGKPSYTYSVLPGGAGGTINSRTGAYMSPPFASSSPNQTYDTIKVVDALSAVATATILVGTPLILLCDIIQQGMGLANGRVYLWDQKIFQPSDYSLYIAVSVAMVKPFGNSNEITNNSSGILTQYQYLNTMATIDIDIISRGPEARDRKEQVPLTLNTVYATQQMAANSFYIGKISTNFTNLSNIDGAAIPYRYKISLQMQYTVAISSPVQYFTQFNTVVPVIS